MAKELPPPSCVESENAVVACILTQHTGFETISKLRPSDFYDSQNRLIWQAMLDLRESGASVDIPSVKGWIERRRLSACINPEDIQRRLDCVPFVSDVGAHAKAVRTMARVRSTIEAAHRISENGYQVNGNALEFLQQSSQILSDVTKQDDDDDERWILPDELFAPMESINWVVPELYICAGRPCEVVAYGYSGKTVACQDILLSVAAGRPVWGRYKCRQGIALHVDHEVGKRGTRKRYKRLAYAAGISPHDLGDRLRVMPLPRIKLNSPDAEDWYMRQCEGATICLIDSLRAAVPGVDEQDSVIREYLDRLLRVSERTGCAFVVIHHAGKGGKEDKREAGRGSSAIFDAAGTVLQLQRESLEDEVTVSKVTMTKATTEASGGALVPFWLRIEDVASDDGADMRAGLQCAFVEHYEGEAQEEDRLLRARKEAVLAALTDRPDGLSPYQIELLVKGKGTTTRKAIQLLEIEGAIAFDKRPGGGRGQICRKK